MRGIQVKWRFSALAPFSPCLFLRWFWYTFVLSVYYLHFRHFIQLSVVPSVLSLDIIPSCFFVACPLSCVKKKSSREDTNMTLGAVNRKKVPAVGVFIPSPAVHIVSVRR